MFYVSYRRRYGIFTKENVLTLDWISSDIPNYFYVIINGDKFNLTLVNKKEYFYLRIKSR